jgi:hypothetical protein
MDSMSQSQTPELNSSFRNSGMNIYDPASYPVNIPPSMIPYLQAAAAAHAQDHQYRSQPPVPMRPPSYLDSGLHSLPGPSIGNMSRYGSSSGMGHSSAAFDLGFGLPPNQPQASMAQNPSLFDSFMKGDGIPLPNPTSTSNLFQSGQNYSPFDWPTGSSSSSSVGEP